MFKKGLATIVILLFLGLAVSPSIYADKDKVSLEPVPDLDCSGEIDFVDAEPGGLISGTIGIENVGEPDSLLNWELVSYPEWSTWTFTPESGTDLLAGELEEIFVEIIVPTEPAEYRGEIVIVNSEDDDDLCIIEVYYDGESVVKHTPIQLVFLLINRLCNHKNIQDIKSEDDVLQIIEEDSELNDIIVKLKNFDCGCEDESNLKWSFPIICLLLSPLFKRALVLRMILHIDLPYYIIEAIGLKLNCFWV